ncbi:hypothetical protein BD626DRAFT_514848 [Schizophyllum amplum]|uniref:F-box domain-containing protein n=1 Tax=Schizophyllum amplum TaxID=97359 RepID=A0A550BYB6_9AGAR|nr:hypothetical protein BD626DRAFT_514848 [Auriculariopsis ampla]
MDTLDFPQELLEMVSSYLQKDVQSLQNLSLSARAWRFPAQRHLFSYLVILQTSQSFEASGGRLWVLLAENPRLANYVRVAKFSFTHHTGMLNYFLDILPLLKELHLHTEGGLASWSSLVDNTWICKHLETMQVTRLRISGGSLPLDAFLHLSTSVAHLDLSDLRSDSLKLRPALPSGFRPFRPRSLYTQDIGMEHLIPLVGPPASPISLQHVLHLFYEQSTHWKNPETASIEKLLRASPRCERFGMMGGLCHNWRPDRDPVLHLSVRSLLFVYSTSQRYRGDIFFAALDDVTRIRSDTLEELTLCFLFATDDCRTQFIKAHQSWRLLDRLLMRNDLYTVRVIRIHIGGLPSFARRGAGAGAVVGGQHGAPTPASEQGGRRARMVEKVRSFMPLLDGEGVLDVQIMDDVIDNNVRDHPWFDVGFR